MKISREGMKCAATVGVVAVGALAVLGAAQVGVWKLMDGVYQKCLQDNAKNITQNVNCPLWTGIYTIPSRNGSCSSYYMGYFIFCRYC